MKKIHFYGDSTIYGQTKKADGTSGVSYWNVPDVTQRMMNEKFGVGAVIVSNKGIPGSRIGQWVNGDVDAGIPSLQERLSSDVPNIIVFEIGLNNALRSDYDNIAFCEFLKTISTMCYAAGSVFILATPNPASDGRAGTLNVIQRSIRNFAEVNAIPLIDNYKAITENLKNWPELLSDYAHPGDNLYLFKGALASAFLQKFI